MICFFFPCKRIKTQSRNALLHGNIIADQITGPISLGQIKKMLSAKIINQQIRFHDQYSRTRRDIKRRKGNLRRISSHFKNMCSIASLSQTDAKACVERLPRFLALVF